jgi:hypothetical protein
LSILPVTDLVTSCPDGTSISTAVCECSGRGGCIAWSSVLYCDPYPPDIYAWDLLVYAPFLLLAPFYSALDNSSVYFFRVAFVIFAALSPLEQLAKGYVLRGQGHFHFMPRMIINDLDTPWIVRYAGDRVRRILPKRLLGNHLFATRPKYSLRAG